MAISVPSTRQAMIDVLKTSGTYLSLHTADPTTTGGSEVSGGSPAYARKQTTWTSGTTGTLSGTEVTFDCPAATVTHVGLWSAASGGTFIAGQALSSSIVLGAQGQVKITPSGLQT